MLVFSDRTLKASGLDFAMARALLKPAEDEVIVHVRQCLDGPPVPHGTLDGITPQGPDARYSLRGIGSEPTDCTSAVYTPVAVDRPQPAATNCGYSAVAPPLMRDLGKDTLDAVFRDAQVLAATYGAELHPAPRGEYTLVTRVGTSTHPSLLAALKSLRSPVEYLCDRLALVSAAPAGPHPLDQPLPPLDAVIPRLDERAVGLDDIKTVAKLLGVQVQADAQGHVLLTGAFGSKVHSSYNAAAAALNRRSFSGSFDDFHVGDTVASNADALPPTWSVETLLEHVPDPNAASGHDSGGYMRRTFLVRNRAGILVAASGDRQDAINQALSICQSTDVPYSAATWCHDDEAQPAAVERVLTDVELAVQAALAQPTHKLMLHAARQLAAKCGLDVQRNPHASGQVMLVAIKTGDCFTYASLRDAVTRHAWVTLDQQNWNHA